MPVTRADMPKIVTRFFGVEGSNQLSVAKSKGAYGAAFNKGLSMQPAAIVDEVKKSNLRGRGGAGFPTGLKWTFIPKDAKQVYLVINADESEPGTCKDRELLFWDPHLLIEGIILSCYALGSDHSYIYIRGEMIREAAVLQKAVDEAYAAGLLGKPLTTGGRGQWKLDVTVHRGAGAYICGEETALLNGLEGKRGWPRLKPPFPAVKGAFGQPTIVNNVETICNIPAIIEKGGEWFAGLGTARSGGTRMLCVSGHVNKPGVYELPMGISFRELIDDVCGGVWKGKKVKCVIPGGSSMPPLDASELDVPIEFDALMTDPRIKVVEVAPGVPFDIGGGKQLRTMAGSGGVVVMDEDADLVAVCARIMQFYANESCGQCTPCREGTGWLNQVCNRVARGQGKPGDVALLASIAHGIGGNTICPLGDAAVWPMLGFLTKFRSEFDAQIRADRQHSAAGLTGTSVDSTRRPDERIPTGATGVRHPMLEKRLVMALLLAPVARLVSPAEISAWPTARILFAAFAVLTLFGAISTIIRKNDIAAVMSLVATFFGLAAVYTFLSAHFIAALQVLVYAGAIMVLFIFVVMVLNRDETDPWVWRGLVSKLLLGAGPMLYVTYKLGIYLRGVTTLRPEAPNEEFGTVAQVGELLFTDYLFAFEAVSILLLIAVIAAVVVARTAKGEGVAHPAPVVPPAAVQEGGH